MSDVYLCAIQDFGQQSSEFVGVFNSDLKRLQTLRPFGGNGVRSALPIDGLIYTISHLRNRAEEGTPIALFDAQSGKELARERSFVLPEKIVNLPKNGMVAVIGGLTEVEFRDARTLALIWTCRPRVIIQAEGEVEHIQNDLPISQAPRTARKPMGDLVEGSDGIARMPFSHIQKTGIFEIDIRKREFRLVQFDLGPADQDFHGGFNSISPDGRWGIREATDLHIERHDRLKSDHGNWYLVTRAFELWDLHDQCIKAEFPAAPEPVLIYERSIKEALAYYDWLKAGDKARGPFGMFGRVPKAPLPGHEAHPHKPRSHLRGESHQFRWEPDSLGVWLVRRYSMMRFDLVGTSGPLIFPDIGLGDAQRTALDGKQDGVDIGRGEAYPHARGCSLIRSISKPQFGLVRFDFYGTILDLPVPYERSDANGPVQSIPKLTARDIEADMPAVIPVKGWTQQAVNEALVDLGSRFEAGLDDLVSGNGLTLLFKHRSAFLDEWTFFEKLREKELVDIPILRELLTRWCDALGDRQWYFTSDETRAAGPMSGALDCLASRDGNCHDILRQYCLKRDGEHESYSRDVVLLGFLERGKLSEIDTLRLAVFFVFLRDQDGRFSVEDGKVVYPWNELGILQAARSQIEPHDFAQLIFDEAAQWGENAKGTNDVINGLAGDLDLSEPWDARLHLALHK